LLTTASIRPCASSAAAMMSSGFVAPHVTMPWRSAMKDWRIDGSENAASCATMRARLRDIRDTEAGPT
jgi:hypothetical protein